MAATHSSAIPFNRTQDVALHRTGAGIPWYIWCAVLAVTSAMIGAHWDISWHSSIGRDSFWTPAHMAIYMCGALSGVAFGYLILSTTFMKNSPLADSSVHIWGFRAPLGAFIASWGGIAMLTSAPFDNWWHDAYGLDVQIVSPPHMVLFLGTYGVLAGTLVLIAGYANRSQGNAKESAQRLFLYVVGIALVMMMVLIMEFIPNISLHRSRPYAVVALLAPIPLAIASRTTRFKFAATAVAGIYTICLIGFVLILPLFPAQPKLGPVYQNVTQFIPPEFPLLLIAPAFALDLLWQRTRKWNRWLLAIVSGFVFTGVLLAVEWPFANFLLSPASRNRLFGTMYFWYGLPQTSYYARHLFLPAQSLPVFLQGITVAVLVASASIAFGLWRGDWMEKVKR